MDPADLRGSDRGYLAYHAPRYAHLLGLLGRYGAGPSARLLDIGASPLTRLLRERLGCAVDTLGFGEDRIDPAGGHFAFDLNRAQEPDHWRRDLPAYDFVILAEVIEHLYTAPALVLGFLATLLAEGGRLVIQTPNAAALPKRIKLLLGRNPYEAIRLDPRDPGHFREYTRAELRRLAAGLGFRVEEETLAFYFDARFAHHESGQAPAGQAFRGAVKNALYRALPPPLREGITQVWRR